MRKLLNKLWLALCLLACAFSVYAQTNGWADGVNIQAAYYNSGNVNLGWSLMNQYPKIKTVRIEIEPEAGVPMSTIQRWISEAVANDKTVICTYHYWQYNGSDDVSRLRAAANWWRTNYATLRQSGNFIVNLMNEWGSHNQTPTSYATAYNEAIGIVRQVYSGPLIIDLPGWGQATHVAAEASSRITDQNIVYSTHIYSNAYVQYGPGRYMTTQDLDVLANAGRPVIVGEFGAGHTGPVDWSAMIDHANSKGWTILGWAWNGDGDRSVYPNGMNMITPEWINNPNATSYTPSAYFNVIYNKLKGSVSSSLTVAPSTLSFAAGASSQTVTVTSNVSWTTTDNQTWITVTPANGSNNGSVSVSVTANTGTTSRSGTVTISGGGITRTVTVTQSGSTAGPNLALNKPVTTSSNESTALAGANAVDGNASTRWSSVYSDPQWIRIDLQNTVNINRVVLRWEAAYARTYRVEVSADGSTWSSIYSTTSGDGGIDDLSTFTGTPTGRYIRIYGTQRATQWGYSLFEVEVYGTQGSTLNVTPASLSVGAGAGSSTLNVTSNVSWTISDNQTWITLSTASGSNNGTVTVNYTANTASSSRSGDITLTGGGITRTVNVTQAGASGSTNLALNKPAVVSSTDGYGGSAAQAVDNNTTTRWASAWSDPQWIYVDLRAMYTINRIVLNWEAAYGRAYQLQVSANGSTWTTIFSTTTGDGGIDDITSFTGSPTGRYVRMYGTQRATQWGYSLWEFQVFGNAATTASSLPMVELAETMDVQSTRESGISIYPNPVVSNEVTVTLPTSTLKSSVNVYDQRGRMMQTIQQDASGKLDVSTLLPGVYYIRVDLNGKKTTHKIIKR